MIQKSTTCFRSDGEPLTEYGSRGEAQEGADYARAEFGNENLVPYSCETCGYFHIGPKDRAPNRTCPNCTGAEGENKDVYEAEIDAMRMVKMKRKRGVVLSTYECPVGNGWHLTKR
ncbi:MAG: hypothetical protein GKS04_04780 [Candidatus Mycalebacterium zealandia]|nr:MAG: hypothetical protein GKS04_04780 [Candidatus Mycalebacterium zealandia]